MKINLPTQATSAEGEDMPTAVDGSTTLRLKLTIAEWIAVGSVLVGIVAFLIQGDRRISQVESITLGNTESIREMKQDIKDINQNIQRMVEYQVVQSRIEAQIGDIVNRMQRLENRIDAAVGKQP